MIRILKLHLGLVKYVNSELRKQKGFRNVVKFFLNLGKAYYTAMLNEYRILLNSLDPKYRKQIKFQKKYMQYKKDLANAWKILQYMIKQGENRTERKQIKYDFERFGKISKEIEEAILRDIYGVK